MRIWLSYWFNGNYDNKWAAASSKVAAHFWDVVANR